MKRIFLHIGTHKTGSTSLQRWLRENVGTLHRFDCSLYRGMHNVANHIELYLSTMRHDRESFAKISRKRIRSDQNYLTRVAERISAFTSESHQTNLILTTEGLSLLRFADELSRLRFILGTAAQEIRIILYLRNREDFLRSYRRQLQKRKLRSPSNDYWSALYVEDDTWLTDYDALVRAYADEFGRSNLTIIDYDREMESRGNIIPSFLEAVGLSSDTALEDGISTYFDNRT